MLTSYLVKCPHLGCDWFGSLLPHRRADGFRGSPMKPNEVLFKCPQCQGEWRARKVGDDVVTLALEESPVAVG
jgi:hypothetical protein